MPRFGYDHLSTHCQCQVLLHIGKAMSARLSYVFHRYACVSTVSTACHARAEGGVWWSGTKSFSSL